MGTDWEPLPGRFQCFQTMTKWPINRTQPAKMTPPGTTLPNQLLKFYILNSLKPIFPNLRPITVARYLLLNRH